MDGGKVVENRTQKSQRCTRTIIFNAEQARFMHDELGMSFAINEYVDINNSLAIKIRDTAELIEVYESYDMGDDYDDVLSDRGKTACSIVNLINSSYRK